MGAPSWGDRDGGKMLLSDGPEQVLWDLSPEPRAHFLACKVGKVMSTLWHHCGDKMRQQCLAGDRCSINPPLLSGSSPWPWEGTASAQRVKEE